MAREDEKRKARGQGKGLSCMAYPSRVYERVGPDPNISKARTRGPVCRKTGAVDFTDSAGALTGPIMGSEQRPSTMDLHIFDCSSPGLAPHPTAARDASPLSAEASARGPLP
jgi:hypothetical protein